MATAFAHEIPDTSHPLARAAGKLALVASAGAGAIAHSLPDRLSDDSLTAELRERGLTGPITAAFLADYRQSRRFNSLAEQLNALPGGQALFTRAMKRSGLLRSDDPGDAGLLAAWDRWKVATASIEASGADAAESADDQFWEQRQEAEAVIRAATATTTAGAVVKLRLALAATGPYDAWFERALAFDDDTTLFARSSELDLSGRMIADALEQLTSVPAALPSPAEQAFEAWVTARMTYEELVAAGGSPEGAEFNAFLDAERALAAAPARTAEDIVLKLLQLAMNEHGGMGDKGPFALEWSSSAPGEPYLEDLAWRGLIDGMLAVSPRIAEVVALPRPKRAPVDLKPKVTSTCEGLLAERQQAFTAAEQSVGSEAAHDRWLGELDRLEGCILDAPAATRDELLAKSLLAVRILSEGATISDERAAAILTEAKALGLPMEAAA